LRITDFEWDSRNEEHIAKHHVFLEEVEEIFASLPLYRKTEEGKYLAYGKTFDGRYLFVVFVFKDKKLIRPITARHMDRKEMKMYKKWLKG
jgi:hypothetical protein